MTWAEIVEANEARECRAACGSKRQGNGWTCGSAVCMAFLSARVRKVS